MDMPDDTLNLDDTIPGPGGGPSDADLSEGSMIGKYRIVRLIGRGGMGQVYEVEHTVLDKSFALKLLPGHLARRPDALARFQREAKVMANLEHEHILLVDDFGEHDGRYFLRMPLVRGVDLAPLGLKGRAVTLQDLADEGGGRVEQALLADLLGQVLDGLTYAHAQGAVHRDIKPANILLEPAGSAGVSPASGSAIHVRITDFGLVRMVGEEWLRSQADISVRQSMSLGEMQTVMPSLTQQGSSTRSLLGTYAYMSPEQKSGEQADHASDLYAVGLIAFRFLTGLEEMAFDLPSNIDDALAPEWDAWVRQALRPQKEKRFVSAAEMATELREAAAGMPGTSEATERQQAEEAERQREQQERARKAREEKRRRAEDQSREREKGRRDEVAGPTKKAKKGCLLTRTCGCVVILFLGGIGLVVLPPNGPRSALEWLRQVLSPEEVPDTINGPTPTQMAAPTDGSPKVFIASAQDLSNGIKDVNLKVPIALLQGQTHRGNVNRTGVFYSKSVRKHPSVKWRVKPGGKINSCPMVFQGRVYVATDAGIICALDAETGAEKWRFMMAAGPIASIGEGLDGNIYPSAPTIKEGILYIGSAAGYLYAVDIGTGRAKWKTTVPSAWKYVVGSPLPAYGVVLVSLIRSGMDHCSVMAVHGETGQVLSVYRSVAPGSASMSLAENRLLVGTRLINMRTGFLQGGTDLCSGSNTTAMYEGRAYAVGDRSGSVSMITASDYRRARKLYSVPIARGDTETIRNGPVDNTLALWSDKLYFGNRQGNLYCHNAMTGSRIWLTKLSSATRCAPSISTVIDSRDAVLYIGCDDGVVQAVDAVTGEKLWTFKTGGTIWVDPWVYEGVVFVASDDGYLYALEDGPR
jgi:serine/threonine protein kinase